MANLRIVVKWPPGISKQRSLVDRNGPGLAAYATAGNTGDARSPRDAASLPTLTRSDIEGYKIPFHEIA
jgi:hypothetical protein